MQGGGEVAEMSQTFLGGGVVAGKGVDSQSHRPTSSTPKLNGG